jgi:hypothetical protein
LSLGQLEAQNPGPLVCQLSLTEWHARDKHGTVLTQHSAIVV